MSEGKEIKIEILAVRLNNRGDTSLRAFVDMKVNDWVINDFRVWKRNHDRAYVTVPQSTWKDPSGQIKFKAILQIPNDQMERIQISILSAYYQKEEERRNETPGQSK